MVYQQVVGIIAILFGLIVCIFNEKFQNIIWIGKWPFGKPISKSETFSSTTSRKVVVYIFGIVMIIFGLFAIFS